MTTRPLCGRRAALRLIAAGGIGAVLTAGGAWLSAALFVPQSASPQESSRHTTALRTWRLPAGVRYQLGEPPPTGLYTVMVARQIWIYILREHATQFPPHVRMPHWRSLSRLRDDGSDRLPQVVRDERGWPWAALSCEWIDSPPGTFTSVITAELAGGLPLPPCGATNSPENARALPFWVLPRGFALDTAFYAAIAFTLWSAPGVIRRHRRRARGRCPACGYDLSGLPPGSPCPECADGSPAVPDRRERRCPSPPCRVL